MSPVLLPFNLRMLAVTKTLMSHKHDCVDRRSLSTLSRVEDISNCKSLTNDEL